MRIILLLALLAFMPRPAAAIEAASDGKATMTMQDYIKDYVDVPKGALDWKVLGATKEKDIEGTGPDGLQFGYTKPIFPDSVKRLDGQTIKVKGFMFPLEEADDQHLFLFGPFPLSCPFHYHVGPSLVIEGHATKPIKFSYDPMVLEGKLELVPEDKENSTFYRMQNAHVVN